jgi:hypothetical protein
MSQMSPSEPAATAAPAPDKPQVAPAPADVGSFVLMVESMPSGAEVLEDGKPLGNTPLQLSITNSSVRANPRRLTVRQRQRLAERMREGSKEHIASMDVAAPEIMDVNQDEVRRTFARYDVDCIIHGHTHRPAVHELQLNSHKAVRIVLGDWYEQGSVLRWNQQGFELAKL